MNGSVKRFLEALTASTANGHNLLVLCDKEDFVYRDKVQVFSGFISPATAKAIFTISVFSKDKVADLSLLANILMSKKFPAVVFGGCEVRVSVHLIRSREKVLENGSFAKILEVSCEYPVLIVSEDQAVFELSNILCEPSGGLGG